MLQVKAPLCCVHNCSHLNEGSCCAEQLRSPECWAISLLRLPQGLLQLLRTHATALHRAAGRGARAAGDAGICMSGVWAPRQTQEQALERCGEVFGQCSLPHEHSATLKDPGSCRQKDVADAEMMLGRCMQPYDQLLNTVSCDMLGRAVRWGFSARRFEQVTNRRVSRDAQSCNDHNAYSSIYSTQSAGIRSCPHNLILFDLTCIVSTSSDRQGFGVYKRQ